jgi:hypothetical protein
MFSEPTTTRPLQVLHRNAKPRAANVMDVGKDSGDGCVGVGCVPEPRRFLSASGEHPLLSHKRVFLAGRRLVRAGVWIRRLPKLELTGFSVRST